MAATPGGGKTVAKGQDLRGFLRIGVAVTALGAGAASAEPSSPPSDIVVLGAPLARPESDRAYDSVVIDRARLTGDASGRIEDVLGDVAGLQQFRRSDSRSANPSAQGLTLRALGGNASSRTLVLLDGVPITDPFFGYVPFNALSAERLSEIRVTRGGGSGAFGAGALSGTVELISAGRDALPPLAANASYGSFGSVQVAATAAPDVGAGYIAVSGRYDRSDGFYTTPESQRVAATARARYRDWSTSIRAVAPIDELTELQASASVLRDDRTLRFKGADSSTDGQDASVRLIHRGSWAVDAIAYLQTRNFTNKVISATTFRMTLNQRDTPATGLGGKIELRPPVGDAHLLRIGGDVRRASGELFEDGYNATTGALTLRRNAGGNQTTAGLFVEDEWKLGDLVVTGGGRVDRWSIADGFLRERNPAGVLTTNAAYADRDGTRATGRAGARWQVAGPLAIRAAAYTGFRLPTPNELYRPFVVVPITTQANADLKLERLRGAEAGIDLTPLPGVSLSATAFTNRLEDAIANVTIATNVRRRQNVDAIVAKGIEASAALRHGPFSLTASYAFNASRVHASGNAAQLDGFIPAQSPRNAANATFAWAPAKGPSLSATVRRIGKQYEDDLQTDILPAVTTVDGVASLPVGHGLTLVARAENVFDVNVITRNAGGSIDYGTPRTLWIGVRLGG
ncbi:TonB-dependent receptor [Sphingomonas sp. BIUV-7]|uniref:TonB-dependent receptor n=1 Tax=Sphingomonas natans TaxID=3063330 RepID=A0ABT8YGA9_9SPHN|nr:TonB-dependent receptor [Sphingomonas sp. BIUV-7]MDO6416895.1 TonB-dependent receptor [Sphingomonas sp. BIUV-7]